MQIPDSYLGLWQGNVKDSNREEPYPCVLALNKNAGEAFYQMKQHQSRGLTKGLLTNPTEKDGSLLLDQKLEVDTGSQTWERGTLSLRLLDDGRLDCVWTGKTYNAESVLSRISPSSN